MYSITSDTIEEKNGFVIVSYSHCSVTLTPIYLELLAEANVDFAALIWNYSFQTESFYRVIGNDVVYEFYDAEDDLNELDYYERIRQWWYSDYAGWNYDTFPYGAMFPESRPEKSKPGMLSVRPSKESSGHDDEGDGALKSFSLSQIVLEYWGVHSEFMKKLRKIFEGDGINVLQIPEDIESLRDIHENEFQILILSYKFATQNGGECIDIIREEKANIMEWTEDEDEFEKYNYKVIIAGTKEELSNNKSLVNHVNGFIVVPPASTKLEDIKNTVIESINDANKI